MKTSLFCKVLFLLLIFLGWFPYLCEAGPFVAYSLREAQKQLMESGRPDADLRELGGMTHLVGVVYDTVGRDWIIVGQINKGHPKITLGDFVVAMRARFIHNEWPLVSIDKTPETRKTGKQTIRFEGGIENSQFAMDLLEADILLKKLALNYLPMEIWGIHSYFAMSVDYTKKGHEEENISTRFWFYPMNPALARREGVFALRELRVAVRAQLISARMNGKTVTDLSQIRDKIGDEFAANLTTHYDDLGAYYPKIKRLKTLFDLVAVAEGLRLLSSQSDMSYWLYTYSVPRIETPKDYPLLKQVEQVQVSQRLRVLEMDGGIELKALVSSLQDGDVTALKDAVLLSRPKRNSLTWRVPLEGWEIPGFPDSGIEEGESISRDSRDRRPKQEKIGCYVTRQISPLGSSVPGDKKFSTPSPPPSLLPLGTGIPKFDFTDKLPPQKHSQNVGGVVLGGTAKILGGSEAKVDLSSGNFSLIVEGEGARLAPEAFRKFVTALWSVYPEKESPGISIDPIGPGIKKHLVRYIGKVINNDLARVMRAADYIMKLWAIGTEKPNIPGFKDVDDLSAKHGLRYLGASRRLWLVPEDMTFKKGGDMLLFEDGRMTVKTEYVLQNKGSKAEPADEAFAKFFTDHYWEISEKYPVYKELFEYAKLVSLARYLKENNVPMLWFLMANADLVITEDSPGTVDALVKGSKHFKDIYIEGGVDLGFEGRYVYDQQAVKAIHEAVAKRPENVFSRTSLSSEKSMEKTGLGPFSFNLGKNSYSVVPQHSLTSGTDQRGIKYQTDVALRYGGEPGLELVRYYDPKRQEPGEFGKGWHLMVPYRVEPYGQKKINFLNAVIPEKMLVKNLLAGREEILTFSKDRYSIAGYVPDRPKYTNLIGLFLISDSSFRLADKLGNEFQFDQGGHLREMVFSEGYHVKYEYGYEKFGKGELTTAPYRIEPVGSEKEAFLNILLPKKMKLVDLIHGNEEIFTFSKETDLGIAGYVPVNGSASQYKILAIMTDGSYVLGDKGGKEISFNPAGGFEEIRVRVMRGISQGDHRIEFEHEIEGEEPRIKEARVMTKESKTTMYAVKYEYGQDRRLCRVVVPPVQKAKNKLDEDRTMVVKKY